MSDKRSLAKKALDEAKQIGKGILGASAALNEPMGDGIPNNPIKGFKEAYSKEEKKQASERAKKSMAYGGTMDMKKVKGMGGKHSAKKMADKRYEHGGIIQQD